MITPCDLGLTYDDFKVEIVKIFENDIKHDDFTYVPTMRIKFKVNDTIIDSYVKLSMVVLIDYVVKQQNEMIINAVKSDIILKYINSISYIRKVKLKKIQYENR